MSSDASLTATGCSDGGDVCENPDGGLCGTDRDVPLVVRQSQDRLKKMYLEGKVLVSYGLSEESGGTPVEDVFVNITLVPKESVNKLFTEVAGAATSTMGASLPSHVLQRSADAGKDRIELSELFVPRPAAGDSSTGTTIRGVLAIGSGGIGKSTVFTCKLPYEWAQGQCMEDVDLLLCIQLGDVSNVQIGSAEELFGSLLDLDGEEKKAVLHYVRENPSRICIVLDGVDECRDIMERASPFMMKLLKGKTTLRGLRTIVTSRPCGAVHRLSQQGCFDHNLEVVGFSRSNVGTFVSKALPSEQATSMMQQLTENAETLELMTTPFMAWLCCEKFRSSGSLSSCTTSLFEKMVVKLLEVQAGQSFAGIKSLPAEQKSIVDELGRFAFEKFVAGQFVFDESDTEFVKLSEMARSLGVFVCCGKQFRTTKKRLYRFSHLLLQEFVAALFMANYMVQTGSDLGEALMHVRCAEPQSMHICVFLLALIKDSAFTSFLDSAVTSFLNSASTSVLDSDDNVGLFRYLNNGSKSSLLDASEMPQIHSALSNCMDRQAMGSLAGILLKDIIPGESVCVAVENRMSRSRELVDSAFLLSLLELWKEKRPLASKSMLCAALQQINDGALLEIECVKQLFISDAGSTAEQQSDLSATVSKYDELLPASLTEAFHGAGSEQTAHYVYGSFTFARIVWLGLLERLQKQGLTERVKAATSVLYGIFILGNANYISGKIASVLDHLPDISITKLNIYDEEGSPGDHSVDGVLSLLKLFAARSGIKDICFIGMNWPSQRLLALSVLLEAHRNTVSEFEVGNNDTSYLNDSFKHVACGVAACSKITEVYFRGIDLDEESIRILSNALEEGKMPLLQKLVFVNVNIGAAGCTSLMQALAFGLRPELRQFGMKNSGLSISCLHSLRALLYMCPALEMVDILKNYPLTEEVHASLSPELSDVAEAIRECDALHSFLLFEEDRLKLGESLPLACEAFLELVRDPRCALKRLW